jgi:membrane-bound metal-dependent hydrolase YbcI (DUF457 family)
MATATIPRTRAVAQRSPQAPACCNPKAGTVDGSTHAATGFLAGAGIGILSTWGHLHGAAAWEGAGHDVLLGFVTAGLALLPDADHPQASFAYAAGGLSHGVSHLLSVLFGGHRAGMHSVFGVGLFSLLAALAGIAFPNRWALGVMAALLAICITAGLRATGFARRKGGALLAGCILAGVAVALVRGELWWLVILGMGLHIFEDEFTGHGCALLWPFSRHRIGGDGGQPAKDRAPARKPPRKHAAGHRPAPHPALSRALKGPAKTTSGPYKPPATFWPSICSDCLTGEHGDCRDRGCQCKARGCAHPLRPGTKALPAAPPPAQPDDGTYPF